MEAGRLQTGSFAGFFWRRHGWFGDSGRRRNRFSMPLDARWPCVILILSTLTSILVACLNQETLLEMKLKGRRGARMIGKCLAQMFDQVL